MAVDCDVDQNIATTIPLPKDADVGLDDVPVSSDKPSGAQPPIAAKSQHSEDNHSIPPYVKSPNDVQVAERAPLETPFPSVQGRNIPPHLRANGQSPNPHQSVVKDPRVRSNVVTRSHLPLTRR